MTVRNRLGGADGHPLARPRGRHRQRRQRRDARSRRVPTFDYAFTVRNRAGLYWYHPHPHGATAAQLYRGLFGLLVVEDDEDLALRRALQLIPGETEIPLVLHDRRRDAPNRYAPTAGDLVHGWYGDESLVNFTRATVPRRRFGTLSFPRSQRVRTLASTASVCSSERGNALPFLLIGTDGGLLESPQRVDEVFVAPAERVDILVDFSGMPIGSFALLESRAFDPMHGELAAAPSDGTAADAPHVHVHPAGDCAVAVSSTSDGRRTRCCNSAVRRRVRPRNARCRSVCRRRPRWPQRPATIGRCASASPKGRWRINDRVYDMTATPIVVAKTRSKRGSSATTTPACRTRCTCTASSFACSTAKRVPISSPRSSPTTNGRAGDGSRLEGHRAGLARRVGAASSSIFAIRSPASRSTCSIATTWSTRTAA